MRKNKVLKQIREEQLDNDRNQGGLGFKILKLRIEDLVPHEGILEWHLREIRDWLERDGFQARPIAVSSLESVGPGWRGKFMIHDGHHRIAALKILGCSFAMCSVFDYRNPSIKVFDYDTGTIPISKEMVVERAVSGVNITPRFDRHFIEIENGRLVPFQENPMIEPEIKVSLYELK
jgi:hypothetical protein